jgi:hypothetical protein
MRHDEHGKASLDSPAAKEFGGFPLQRHGRARSFFTLPRARELSIGYHYRSARFFNCLGLRLLNELRGQELDLINLGRGGVKRASWVSKL